MRTPVSPGPLDMVGFGPEKPLFAMIMKLVLVVAIFSALIIVRFVTFAQSILPPFQDKIKKILLS